MTNQVKIDPMAAYTEATWLNEQYKQRNLLLANKISDLTKQLNSVTLERDKWLEEMQRLQQEAQKDVE